MVRHPPLDLRELQCVCAIALQGSIHGAARALNSKQSAVSRSLRLLEERVGIQLFRRTSSGTTPTSVGEAFLRQAEALLHDTNALYEYTRRCALGESGIVSIGIQSNVPPGRVSAFIEPYRILYPGISFIYRDVSKRDVISALFDGIVDLVIIALPLNESCAATLPLWSDRIVAVTPTNHPLASSVTTCWSDLREETFVFGNDDTGEDMSTLLKRKASIAGFLPTVCREEIISLRTIALVINGHGITLMPAGWLAFFPGTILEQVTVLEVRDGDGFSHLDYGIGWRDRNLSTVAHKILVFLGKQNLE